MSDIDCPHCHATFDNLDVRMVVGRLDGTAVAIKHTKDCVDYPDAGPGRPGEEPAP